ncbi:MAG TPA: RDD family protein [Acidobacteriota bacterium]|nr:RDD family protein [Acidobacteriota bacterium]
MLQTARSNLMNIQTPEGITFPLVIAGPIVRFLALFIDQLCVIVALMFILRLIEYLAIVSPDFSSALAYLTYFSLSIGYPIATEWFWRGQTLGKRLFGLRVMDVQGLRLQFSQIAIRNLLRFVDSLPLFYIVGGITCVLSRHYQRLGDLAANTIVVRTPDLVLPDVGQVMAGKFNSFRDYPHLAARLRQRISAKEATIALEALLRRDQLESTARLDLFGEIADRFRQTVEFPMESVEGLTDEQYVRNAVDILFSARKA